MINEGFRALVQAGVLKRKVLDDRALMRRLVDGSASGDDRERLQREGEFLHGAFYLGSPAFYAWLRGLDDATRRGIGMRQGKGSPRSHAICRRGPSRSDSIAR